MTREERIQLLTDAQVLQTGHFRLTSGRHSDKYMQCARVFEDPKYAMVVCEDIANVYRDQQIDVVVGPAVGGIIITYEVARQLGVLNVFAERENGALTFRRGFSIQPGARVLVVEDTITTGGSVQETINLVREKGGNVIGVGSVVDRSNGTVDFGVPLHAFLSTEVQSYEESECPLCKAGMPIIKPGSRVFAK